MIPVVQNFVNKRTAMNDFERGQERMQDYVAMEEGGNSREIEQKVGSRS